MKASEGTRWCREDVEVTLCRELTSAEWQKVQESRWWQDGIVEQMTQTGFECISSMLSELDIDEDMSNIEPFVNALVKDIKAKYFHEHDVKLIRANVVNMIMDRKDWFIAYYEEWADSDSGMVKCDKCDKMIERQEAHFNPDNLYFCEWHAVNPEED